VCGEKGCGLGFTVSIGDFGLTTFSRDMKPTEDVDSPTQPQPQGRGALNITKSDSIALSTVAPVPIPNSSLNDSHSCAASVGCLREPRHVLGCPATLIRSRSRSGSRNSPRSVKHTTGVGSMSYASPEQIGQHFYDEKTDIFSLGIICFQLFSPPFSTRMERAKVFEQLRAGLIPRQFSLAHPKEAELIKSCLAKEPEDRPSTSDILAMDIWEPAPCIYLRDSSYAVTIPRAMFKRMQNEITQYQQEIARLQQELAKATGRSLSSSTGAVETNAGAGGAAGGRVPPLSPRRIQIGRSCKQTPRNSDLPSLF